MESSRRCCSRPYFAFEAFFAWPGGVPGLSLHALRRSSARTPLGGAQVRGNMKDEVAKKARDDALEKSAAFFREHLKK